METIPRDKVIVGVGDRHNGLHFLCRGAVGVSVARPSLEVAPVHIITGPEWIGSQSALSSLPSPAEYRSLVDCELLAVPSAAVASLKAGSASGSDAFAELLAMSMDLLFGVVGNLSGFSADYRVKATLLSASNIGAPADDGGITLPISQEFFAAVTCTSRSTLSKLLLDLQQRNIIKVAYRRINVLDREALQEELLAGA